MSQENLNSFKKFVSIIETPRVRYYTIQQKATTFWFYLRQKDWQVVLDQGIGVDDGLVEVLVQDFPGKQNKDKKFE